ncbi:MAG TPA: OmpA family protein [Thiobacillaceae bacterium]|nr:OmpA family protein [Thiobacillaceae bacterium]
MRFKPLSLALALALASSPLMAATKDAAKVKATKVASSAQESKPADAAVIYPVAQPTLQAAPQAVPQAGGYTANMVQVPAGQTPQTSEQWLSRMGDFTQNASAFKDPRAFEAWLGAMTNPNTAAAAIPMMMEPGNWLHSGASMMQPGVINNYVPFMVDPSIYLRWTAAMMDPGFYMRNLASVSDPNKMMRWMVLPMDPRVWQGAMNMMNPNMYMKWMMAPTDPRALSMMFAPFNPQLYGSMMGAVVNPNLLGSNWATFMQPAQPVVGFGPAAPVTPPINVMDPSTWTNVFNMFGGFGNVIPGFGAPVGGQVPATAMPPLGGFTLPGFSTANNPYLTAQAAPAPAPSPAAEPAASATFQPGTPATLTLSGDTLFKSGKSSARYLTIDGKKSLNDLADRIKAAGAIDTIKVTGHADKTGKASSNMKLSLARARSVANYLKSKGVKAAKFITAGKGDTQPVKECDMKLPKAELIACLQPNRRVEVEVTPAK